MTITEIRKFRPYGGTIDKINRCETIDEGTSAFMQWLNSEDKKSINSGNPLILLKFVNDKHTIIHDSLLGVKMDANQMMEFHFVITANPMTVHM